MNYREEYGIEYGGMTERENGLFVVRRPDIPSPQRRVETVTTPRTDGDMYIYDGAVEDVELEIEFNFIGSPNEWAERFRSARRWLLNSSSTDLILGDDRLFMYKVKMVTIDTAERVCYEIGKFATTFTCEGYQYLIEGAKQHDISDVLMNEYDEAHPVYYITGEGVATLTVNGNSMTANVGQNIVIDTERKICYKGSTLANTDVSGYYEDLYLVPGANTISITSGFTLKVQPNWRSI